MLQVLISGEKKDVVEHSWIDDNGIKFSNDKLYFGEPLWVIHIGNHNWRFRLSDCGWYINFYINDKFESICWRLAQPLFNKKRKRVSISDMR